MSVTETATKAALDYRPFASLGKADHGWLKANHHFSFASYYDPDRMHWGAIRVWNDDEIAAQSGFPPHPHDNMEIITYVREGAITHRDCMGNVGRTEAGDVQVMSAGTGVTHSEYNLEDSLCRLFQIWIMPRARNIAPRWDQQQFPKADRSGQLSLLASGYGEDGALAINADARLFAATLAPGSSLRHQLGAGHAGYLVSAKGEMIVNGQPVSARDGLAIEPSVELAISCSDEAELVLVETTV
jgi:quercetin 2,3-dioxygenase